jgi:UDP-glucuronate 4-epimerase
VPFSVEDPVDHPVSLYAATKKANELMAHSYSHLFALPTTGLRYFTVYGPWGRPDMSPWLFTSAMLEDRSIDVFNHGQMQRDFTFIDDIAEGTVKVLDTVPAASPSLVGTELKLGSSHAPYRVYNIGNHSPVALMEFIGTLESALGLEAKKRLLPMQPGDVVTTYADVADLTHDTGFAPSTTLETGLAKWVDWYLDYHGPANVAYKS